MWQSTPRRKTRRLLRAAQDRDREHRCPGSRHASRKRAWRAGTPPTASLPLPDKRVGRHEPARASPSRSGGGGPMGRCPAWNSGNHRWAKLQAPRGRRVVVTTSDNSAVDVHRVIPAKPPDCLAGLANGNRHAPRVLLTRRVRHARSSGIGLDQASSATAGNTVGR
jgi:hypothetical protein